MPLLRAAISFPEQSPFTDDPNTWRRLAPLRSLPMRRIRTQGGAARCAPRPCAMVIAVPTSTVNRFYKVDENPRFSRVFPVVSVFETMALEVRFIALLKLPFKFDEDDRLNNTPA